MQDLILIITVSAIPVLFAITVHEAAHGYVAQMFGDPTAYNAGRISLNPIRHIDPVGTIAVPIFILLSSKLLGGGSLLFGWAKPVPIDYRKLRNPKQNMLWVALAGPASNLLMAAIWAFSLIILVHSGVHQGNFWYQMSMVGITINIVLMTLNMLPIPPLDGGRVVFSLLPYKYAHPFSKLEPYGLAIVLVLLFTGLLWSVIRPVLIFTEIVINWFL